jgi:hypothetical protein
MLKCGALRPILVNLLGGASKNSSLRPLINKKFPSHLTFFAHTAQPAYLTNANINQKKAVAFMKLKKIHFERTASVLQILPAILVVTATALAPDAAHAQSSNNEILNRSCSTLQTIKTWLFSIAYVLGAIGLVVIAVSAFLGRFKFAHLISLGGGLFIVAFADLLIRFATSGTDSQSCDIAG